MAEKAPWDEDEKAPWDEAAPQGEEDIGALDLAMRGLDYAGGLTRTGAASLADIFTKENIVTAEDLKKALKGKAPGTAEYLERAGVPEGMKLSDVADVYAEPGTGGMFTPEKGGSLDPSVRGVAGFVGDVALDPLTYASLGTTGAAKAGKLLKPASSGSRSLLNDVSDIAAKTGKFLLNPASKTSKAGGDALYKSAFKNIDTRLAEKGQRGISEYAQKQGWVGGLKTIQSKMNSRVEELMAKRNELYKMLDESGGAVVDPNKALESSLDKLAKMSERGGAQREKADTLFKTLSELPTPDRPGGVSIQRASDIKTSLYDSLPPSAFNQFGTLTSDGSKLLKTMSKGYKDEIVKAADRVVPGSGKEIDDINKELGALLNAEKPTMSEIAKEDRKDAFTQVKAALASLSPAAAAMMFGAKGVNTPLFRTSVGTAMKYGGQASEGILDPMLRQGLVSSQRDKKERSPWEDL